VRVENVSKLHVFLNPAVTCWLSFFVKSTILSITYAAKQMMQFLLSVSFSTCVLCPRIDPLCFLANCRRRQLNQGLVVAVDFLRSVDRACFCVIFWFPGEVLSHYLFVITISVIDCPERLVTEISEMTCYVLHWMLNPTNH